MGPSGNQGGQHRRNGGQHCRNAQMEGRMEERKRFAIKLLKSNASIEDIINLTELSAEQVKELMN